MSIENNDKNERRGGYRKRAGHPKTGETKTKISISVDELNWQAALERWKDKGSRLVDRLIVRYNDTDGSILKPEPETT